MIEHAVSNCDGIATGSLGFLFSLRSSQRHTQPDTAPALPSTGRQRGRFHWLRRPAEDWLLFCSRSSLLLDIHIPIGKGCADEVPHVEGVYALRGGIRYAARIGS